MSVELRPLGVLCNLSCQYCYQNPQRDARNIAQRYDLEAMKAAVLAEGGPFTLFGGEPLLVPKPDLEALWSWGLEQFGENSIQTNGALIDDDHIRMFRQYRVGVGISIDGPGALNDVRSAGSLEQTRKATARIEEAIERLCGEGLPPSLIITLHRANASADRLPLMARWFRHLDRLGIASARLHVLESEDQRIRDKYALSSDENLAAMRHFAALERELGRLRFDIFGEARKLLQGDDRSASCVWRACDPYTTSAVRGVEGFGQRSNCGRTNKDGIDFVKAGVPSYARYLALYHTPQADGGCRDCRFFLMCKGQCPGTAIDNDWRNRTEHCELWMSLFAEIEAGLVAEGIRPLSLSPQRSTVEQTFLAAWAGGANPGLHEVLRQLPESRRMQA